MKLTRFTDYSLRVLIYLGMKEDGRVTIREISEAYGISRNHLMKVVSLLTRMEYLDARRGPGGGIALARSPSEIVIADVIRDMEDDLNLVECFCEDGSCLIKPMCVLKSALNKALKAYLDTLEQYTLSDLLKPKTQLAQVFGMTA
ncbi:MAG: Rrf2 family transcriptional regulator [Xanthomonadales bacterium]|jgi:Rrf2 family nitric oxide-sensitive transcriptional repressor|nr:Rrf2 family transcriptional regulator [Xanthomonadales bacterium]MDH3923961.1 Rrf2 family transcriptional regulator [Xanthomonadales bacterium]MDH3940571.1 Rrf2 family transcriptional regulator [Xanthomonadales bacterium]MDH4002140.1 Rrf2 family transcriptional regulator [Xanthomonadales bacterium]